MAKSDLFFNDIKLPFYEYINGGFQIVNETHRPFFKDVLDFYFKQKTNLNKIQKTFGVGTDQTPINYLLRKHNIDLNLLPYEFNMNDMNRKEILGDDLLFTKVGYVYHFNAIPPDVANKRDSHYWMDRVYKELYEGIQK